MYNKIIPVFWGPLDLFISNNIKTAKYAENVVCPVYVIGSNADKTLDAALQQKVAKCFDEAQLEIFEDVSHENYLVTEEVVLYIKDIMK